MANWRGDLQRMRGGCVMVKGLGMVLPVMFMRKVWGHS